MRLIPWLILLMLCSCLALAQDADEGWIDLFNGQDLTGWKLVDENGRQSWSVVEGVLTNVATHEERGTDLMTERTFTDHELHVEFRVPQGGNSGVYLQGRYECQIADSAGRERPGMGDCGAIYSVSAPLAQAAKPAGEWQTYDITFIAPKVDREGRITAPARVTVKLNDVVVQDDLELVSGEPKLPRATGGQVDNDLNRPGCLMLQGNHTSIEYRNIRYRPLKVDWADEAEFTPLFDGTSLDGWHTAPTGHGTGGKWEVVDGVITGTQDPPGNGGLQFSDRRYGDFEIRCELNPDFGIDSGLFFRTQENGDCYQATVDYRPGGEVSTIYGEGIGGWLAQNPGWEWFYQRDTWNEIRAIVEGNPPRIQVWLNGNLTVDWTDTEKRLPDDGFIALQVHGGGDWGGKVTRFRNIRIRELN